MTKRSWLAVDATWFGGGRTHVNGVESPDEQRNVRLGATLSLPISTGHSLKLIYSTGATTRRGSDFDTFTAQWQVVTF